MLGALAIQLLEPFGIFVGGSIPPRGWILLGHGLEHGCDVFDDLGLSEAYEDANEVQLLRGMREALVPKLPVSQLAELEERLRSAIDSENYELAAILRDELRLARSKENPPKQ